MVRVYHNVTLLELDPLVRCLRHHGAAIHARDVGAQHDAVAGLALGGVRETPVPVHAVRGRDNAAVVADERTSAVRLPGPVPRDVHKRGHGAELARRHRLPDDYAAGGGGGGPLGPAGHGLAGGEGREEEGDPQARPRAGHRHHGWPPRPPSAGGTPLPTRIATKIFRVAGFAESDQKLLRLKLLRSARAGAHRGGRPASPAVIQHCSAHHLARPPARPLVSWNRPLNLLLSRGARLLE